MSIPHTLINIEMVKVIQSITAVGSAILSITRESGGHRYDIDPRSPGSQNLDA
jgi:hypothetical protein